MIPTPEPTSVLQPPTAKSASRAALQGASPDVDVMPDPATIEDAEPAALSPGDADDLIARLADEQIDRLLAGEESDAPVAVAAPQPVVAEAVPTTPAEVPFVERRNVAANESPGFPASFSPPGKKTFALAESAELFADPLLLASSTAEASVAPPADAHDALRSDAAAVADELAADLARSPARVPAAPPEPIVAPGEPAAAPEPTAMHRAVHAIGAVPTAIFDLINLPLRAANDAIREAIGAIAIVTLANAAALLLYLMIFQR